VAAFSFSFSFAASKISSIVGLGLTLLPFLDLNYLNLSASETEGVVKF
jgi:hypothetical protein